MIQKQEVYSKLVQAESCPGYMLRFQGTLQAAQNAYSENDLEACARALDTLPTADALYVSLLSKLKNRRFVQILNQIDAGVVFSHYTKLKALTSLLTHTVIECEQGSIEYELIIPKILDAINVLAFTPYCPLGSQSIR